MKNFHFLLFWLICIGTMAQSPQAIPYQAVLRNADGSIMSNAAATITFKIHEVTATGTVVYQETHSATTNGQGLVSVHIGSGSVVSGTFAAF